MLLKFYKYQGAGNDFIVLDNRQQAYSHLTPAQIRLLCHRRFGIGADGLMLLAAKEGFDFEMIYHNADGNLGSMCGNGGRCIAAFAHLLGLTKNMVLQFLAVDGPHEAILVSPDFVELKMGEVSKIFLSDAYCFLDTGSPHHIEFVDQLAGLDVYQKGKNIRYSEKYRVEGVNVNFVERLASPNALQIATYERGVEDETLACGTGVTAAALAYFLQYSPKQEGQQQIAVQAKGGLLNVKFNYYQQQFSEIWLSGPAQLVFEGEIDLAKLNNSLIPDL